MIYISLEGRGEDWSAASVREQVNIVQCTFTDDNVRLIDEPIAFISIDSTTMLLPHEDALVLTLGVSDFNLHRILIDLGRFTNLLQMLAYTQMGHSPSALENLSRILIGFNRASTMSLGNVVLLVQVGLVILKVRFSVVEDLSPYNAIMGWVGLHKMKVISST